MRSKYETKSNAPEDMKWVFDSEWTDVNYDSLPEGIKKYKPLLLEKSYINKWKSKIGSEDKWNYELKDFKKTTVQKLVDEESLDVNDSLFLKGKENESLTLLKIETNPHNRNVKVYDFMYSKDRKTYTFYKDTK